MKLNTKYQSMPKEYFCKNCGTIITAPMHCGHPMHFEELNGVKTWVCWMGEHCGKQEYTPCCNNPILKPKQTR